MTILLSHPTGNQFVRNALASFEDAGINEEFATSIAAYPTNLWGRLSKTKLGAELTRRTFDPRHRDKTFQRPWRELGRLISPRLGLNALVSHESGMFCVDRVYRSQDRSVARRLRWHRARSESLKGVYCYEDGAFETFRSAKSLSLRCLYDLPIGNWRAARRLMQAEHERWPEWRATIP